MKAKIYTYGGTEPIPLRGIIQVKVNSERHSTQARLHVTKGDTGTLLGSHTEEDIGLVFFARQVHLSHAKDIMQEFPQLFQGLGCLKDRKIKLHIDKTIHPTALRHRQVLFHLRPLVEKELNQLEHMGVIE